MDVPASQPSIRHAPTTSNQIFIGTKSLSIPSFISQRTSHIIYSYFVFIFTLSHKNCCNPECLQNRFYRHKKQRNYSKEKEVMKLDPTPFITKTCVFRNIVAVVNGTLMDSVAIHPTIISLSFLFCQAHFCQVLTGGRILLALNATFKEKIHYPTTKKISSNS